MVKRMRYPHRIESSNELGFVMSDSFYPLGFIVLAAFASGLVWVYMLTANIPIP
jgi:hypothetical protein